MVLVANPMFWGMGNHLRPFSEASDLPEGIGDYVSSMLRSWVTSQVRISLLEVLLVLQQPLRPVLGLQVDLRILITVLNNSPYPKHWFCHKNHVSSMLWSWVTPQVRISLLEILLDLVQPVHPVLVHQVDLRLLKMVWKDSPYNTRAMSLACLEADISPELEFYILIFFLNSYSPSTQFSPFRSLWDFW